MDSSMKSPETSTTPYSLVSRVDTQKKQLDLIGKAGALCLTEGLGLNH